jgi:hypothetical protein
VPTTYAQLLPGSVEAGCQSRRRRVLLNILLVRYQSMKESGMQRSVITEDELERQMQRWIGARHFSEHAIGADGADNAREQYASQHPEQLLLTFECRISEHRLKHHRARAVHRFGEPGQKPVVSICTTLNCSEKFLKIRKIQ